MGRHKEWCACRRGALLYGCGVLWQVRALIAECDAYKGGMLYYLGNGMPVWGIEHFMVVEFHGECNFQLPNAMPIGKANLTSRMVCLWGGRAYACVKSIV